MAFRASTCMIPPDPNNLLNGANAVRLNSSERFHRATICHRDCRPLSSARYSRLREQSCA